MIREALLFIDKMKQSKYIIPFSWEEVKVGDRMVRFSKYETDEWWRRVIVLSEIEAIVKGIKKDEHKILFEELDIHADESRNFVKCEYDMQEECWYFDKRPWYMRWLCIY